MKRLLLILPLFVSLSTFASSKVESLMRKMTMEEKIGQLWQMTYSPETGVTANKDVEGSIRRGEIGSILSISGAATVRHLQDIAVKESRLGIPLIIGVDVIHGYETCFPTPLAMTASWDMKAIERADSVAALEASRSGIAWTFAPMCDVCRDPRWGRIGEGAGEDPYLGAQVAAAQVRGFQGNFEDGRVAACVKHFALYGGAMGGRDYNTVEMSRYSAYNDYFPSYRAAVEAGSLTVMTAFNEFEGVPATINRYLLTDVLRKDMGFDGMVVTDYGASGETIAHGACADMKEVAQRCIDAGVDMEMVHDSFHGHLLQLLKEGKVSRRQIDAACRRVLELKDRMGLLDDPYRFCREDEEALNGSAENQEISRRIADECIILLKNNGILPLKEDARIALIGPMAKLWKEQRGVYTTAPQRHKYTSIYEGLKERFPNVECATGCHVFPDFRVLQIAAYSDSLDLELDRDPALMKKEALDLARRSDVIVASMGEVGRMAGEGASRTDLELAQPQKQLLRELVATGKPVVLLVTASRPLILSWEDENVSAIVHTWSLGSRAGAAVADILSGDVNPSGRAPVSFPRNMGQIPVFYNHKNTGRPWGEETPYKRFWSNYLDSPVAPLYPFGYGLSYSGIEYGPVELSSAQMPLKGTVTASVTLANKSGRDAVEVVQLYIRDLVASCTRPVSELRGFRRVTVPAGGNVKVTFDIDAKTLGFYNGDLKWVTEPGEFRIMIGPNSRDTAKSTLTVTEK